MGWTGCTLDGVVPVCKQPHDTPALIMEDTHMTIKDILSAIGIADVNKDVSIEPTVTQPEEPTIEPTAPAQPEAPTTQPTQVDVRLSNTQEQTSEELLKALQKENATLKEVNARLMAQTPVVHQPTADDALLELLGIGGNENGEQ